MEEVKAQPQPRFVDQRQYELFTKCMGEINLRRDPAESAEFLKRMEGIRGNRKFLSEEMYAQLKSLAPIACVDVLVVVLGPGGEVAGVLVPRRIEEGKAAEGLVWPIGGRTFYREDLEDTIAYNVFSESGGLQVKMMGAGPIAIGRTEFDIVEKGRDTINLTYLAAVVGGELQPSRYFSEYVFVDKEMFAREMFVRKMFLNNPEMHHLCNYTYELLKASDVFTGKPNPGIPMVRHNERTDKDALREAEEAIIKVRRKS
jgi:hypothetical protein